MTDPALPDGVAQRRADGLLAYELAEVWGRCLRYSDWKAMARSPYRRPATKKA